MTLLEQALSLLGDQVDDKADGWFEKLTGQLEGLLDATTNEELKAGGLSALQVLKDNQNEFAGLGKKSLILFISHVAADKSDEAAKEYYRSKASADEIINSLLDDAFDIDNFREQRDELKKEALELAKLLLTGAKFLLPLLLAI